MARSGRATLLSPSAYFRRVGLSKGLLGGQRGWLFVGGVFWVGRIMKRAVTRSEQFVTIERMEPGQWMSLRTIPAPSRKERKATKSSSKAATKRSAKKSSAKRTGA